VQIVRAILEAAKKLVREPYSLSELAAAASVTRKTARRWLSLLRTVAELLVLPLETRVAYFEGPGRGRKRRRKRLTTVSLALR
jgi:response regulator of citrate/malate metabolism